MPSISLMLRVRLVAQALDGALQLGGQVGMRRPDHGHAHRAHGTVAVERPGQVLQRKRIAARAAEDASACCASSRHFGAALAGEHEQLAVPFVLQPGRLVRPGVFFQDGVRIDAAEAESVHARAPRRFGRSVNPGPRLGVDVEIGFFELQLGVGIFAQRRRQHFVMQSQRGFDQSRHAGGGHGVADHGFHRAQRAARRFGLARRKHAPQRLHFHHIADRRAGAVRFQQPDGERIDARRFVGAAQRQFFAFQARRQHMGGPAIARNADVFQHCIDMVAIALGLRQALQHHHADAFAQQRAVGVFIERAQLAAMGERAELREDHHQDRRGVAVHAAGQGQIAAARIASSRAAISTATSELAQAASIR